MNSIAKTCAIICLCGAAPAMAIADPMEDVCHLRAKDLSGYTGKPGLILGDDRVGVRLSGFAAVGISRQNKAGTSDRSSPAFAGSSSTERREQEKARKYQRTYDDCIGGS